MKNKRLAFLLLLTGLLTNTWVLARENPLLKFVPADTWLFSGNTRLINIADYPLTSLTHSLELPMAQNQHYPLAKEGVFFYQLLADLENTLQQGGQALQSHYGLSSELAMVVYSVGATPVIKLRLDNAQALWRILDQAEAKSGLAHKLEQFATLSYRSYVFGDNVQFIVNIQQQADKHSLATFALFSNNLSDKSKKLILGLEHPQPSIAETAKLETIARENQYLPVSISFIDLQELVRSLFQENNNPWVMLLGTEQQIIADLQATKCARDVQAITQDVPRLIAGYKKYLVQGQQVQIAFEALLELNNHNVNSQLNLFRGFIPAYVRHGANENIVAVALGANMSQLSPLFVYITQVFKESTFSCPAFIDLQQTVAQLNPAMLALVTGAVDGIHGLSFAIQDFNLVRANDTSTAVKSATILPEVDISMILSLATENPLQVWRMLMAFFPALAPQNPDIMPTEQPQQLNLPELNELGLEVFFAVKGQHLVLYSGEQAARISQQLTDENIMANGFFQESLNYTRLTLAVQALRDYLNAPGWQQPLPAEMCNYFDESLAMLSRLSGFIDFRSDFVTSGWLNVMSADITMLPPAVSHHPLPGQYETFAVQDGCQLAKDGREQILADGTGLYQQYSEDGRCFIFETRYRWSQSSDAINLQYLGERRRPEGNCSNAFDRWAVPEPEYINDSCLLRSTSEGSFACLYQWDEVLAKMVYKRI